MGGRFTGNQDVWSSMKRTSLDQWIKSKHDLDTSDRSAVEQYQLRRIRSLCDYAHSHSKLYARLYHNFDLPESMEAFSHFPMTTASDLAQRAHEFLCVSQSEITRIVTLQTSGTTQPSKRVYFTRQDIDLTLDFFEHGMKTLCGPGDSALILFPAKTPDSVGALLAIALEKLGLTVCCATPEYAEDIFQKQTVDIVCGPASWIFKVAHQTTDCPVRNVLSSSEVLSEDMRAELTRCWGAEIFDHYGMTETGLGGAVECGAHQGMHIRENDLYFETIALDGSALPDGEEGELVVTTLTRTGMPFIRYRTGDRGVITRERCSCGSLIRRILYVRRIEAVP